MQDTAIIRQFLTHPGEQVNASYTEDLKVKFLLPKDEASSQYAPCETSS